MDTDPPSPPPEKDRTLWYYRLRRHTVLDRFRKWIDFRRGVALVVLGAIVLWLFHFLVMAIPHPYAGSGIVVFLVLGALAFFAAPRRRVLLIGMLAVVIVSIVLVLHIHAKQYVVIKNDSGIGVKHVEVYFWKNNDECFILNGGNLAAGSEADTSFLLPGYKGKIQVWGELADGTTIGGLGIGATGPYRGRTQIIIEKGGGVVMMHP